MDPECRNGVIVDCTLQQISDPLSITLSFFQRSKYLGEDLPKVFGVLWNSEPPRARFDQLPFKGNEFELQRTSILNVHGFAFL